VQPACVDLRAADGEAVVDRTVVDDALADADPDEADGEHGLGARADRRCEAAGEQDPGHHERRAATMPERGAPEDDHRREARDMPDRSKRGLQRRIGSDALEEIREDRRERADDEVAHRMKDARCREERRVRRRHMPRGLEIVVDGGYGGEAREEQQSDQIHGQERRNRPRHEIRRLEGTDRRKADRGRRHP